MDLEARPFRCFVAVAELNSFSRAAQRINVSQPALSATIKELERRIGFLLFDRTSRHVKLTAEGGLFLGNARRYIRESDILRQSWQQIRSNDLRISAAFHTSLIAERNMLIEGFLAIHQDLNLQILNDHHGRGFAKLAQGEVDLLIALEPESPSSDIEVTTMQGEHKIAIERIVLSSRQVGLLIPAEHPFAGYDAISLNDLENESIVVPNRFHGVAISEQLRFALESVGAQIIRPPEGNALGVERYGAMRRLLSVTLNWFAPPDAEAKMVSRSVEGLGITQLSLIRMMTEPRQSAARFWSFAQQEIHHLVAPTGS